MGANPTEDKRESDELNASSSSSAIRQEFKQDAAVRQPGGGSSLRQRARKGTALNNDNDNDSRKDVKAHKERNTKRSGRSATCWLAILLSSLFSLLVLFPLLAVLLLLYFPRYFPYTTTPELCCNITKYDEIQLWPYSSQGGANTTGEGRSTPDEELYLKVMVFYGAQSASESPLPALYDMRAGGEGIKEAAKKLQEEEKGSKFEEKREEEEEERACVLVVHGHGANIMKEMPWEKSILTKAVLPFVSAGYHVITFDQRNHGQSAWRGGGAVTLGYREAEDVRALIDWLESIQALPSTLSTSSERYPSEVEGEGRTLQNKLKCKGDKVLVWGESMGAATALFAASRDSRISAVVSNSSFLSLHKVLASWVLSRLPFVPLSAIDMLLYLGEKTMSLLEGLDMSEIDVGKALRETEVPILFVHGRGDLLVPMEHAVELYDIAQERRKKGGGESAKESSKVIEESCAVSSGICRETAAKSDSGKEEVPYSQLWLHDHGHVRSYKSEEYYPLLVDFAQRYHPT